MIGSPFGRGGDARRLALALGLLAWASPAAVDAQDTAPPPDFDWGPTLDEEEDDDDGLNVELGLAVDLGALGGLDTETLGLGVGQSAAIALLVRPHPVISVAAGAHVFAMYGDGPVAWFGSRLGLRFHWGSLISGFEPDAWIDLSHLYGFSGPIAGHGFDVGLGFGFRLFEAMTIGPFARLAYIADPDGTPVYVLSVGLSVTGWPAREGAAPPAYRSNARRPRYVAPQTFAEVQPRQVDRVALLPHVELFGMHALDDGHRDSIGLGGGLAATIEFPIVPWLGVQAGAIGMGVSALTGSPAAWVGTQLGVRFHWSALAELEGDAWIDAHHVYGISGGITTHGADVGLGYSFDALSFLRVGPFVRGILLTDPGNEPAYLLAVGIALAIRAPERGPGNRDGDERLDREDHCTDIEGGASNDPDNPGCPLLDRDGDGVPDNEDLCTSEPVGDTPDPTRRGCPLPDHDGDTVPDDHDFCEDQNADPGVMDPLRDGCPEGAL